MTQEQQQQHQQRKVPMPFLEEQSVEQEDLERGSSQESVRESEDATSLRRTTLPCLQESESACEDVEREHGLSPLSYIQDAEAEHEVHQHVGHKAANKVNDVTSLLLSPLPYLQEPVCAYEDAEEQDRPGAVDGSLRRAPLTYLQEAKADHEIQEQVGQGAEQKVDDAISLRSSPCPYLQEADDLEQGGIGKQDVDSLTPRSRALPYIMD